MMIKVLQIGLSSNPGGMESCILNYHRFIDKTTFQFDYADIYGKGIAHSDEIRALNGHIYILSNYKKHPIKMAYELKKLIKAENYNIIHINTLSAANMIPEIVSYKVSDAAVIVHSHNTAVPSGKLRKFMNSFNLRYLRNLPVEKWGCGEKAGRWMWGKQFDVNNIIPNAIDLKKFSLDLGKRKEIRQICNFSDNDIVLGFVGRFSEQKNVLFLPQILKKLMGKDNRYKLLLVGGGVLGKELKKEFKRLGLMDCVYFAGVQNDVSDWYQAMDAFLLPSLFEGLPVVGVEAQAAGLQCFVSDKITKEINITRTVKYIPIDEGSVVWANTIMDVLDRKNLGQMPFPEEYNIRTAVKTLEQKYIYLQLRGKRQWKISERDC